ncbi:Rv3654c family TadE-like protein [Cryobacterium sp.]|uniref:Rv3654c family TadE-like protein n=1 Tax=Cryobacterium sp. TaxID=1926290 RepID=UPI002636DC46|nr:Rv3654c family TadE-like protein [Cryobacterium sp.]MCU1445171.1 helicase [Cryobacterium sp.]
MIGSRRIVASSRRAVTGDRGAGSVLVVALLGAVFTMTAVLIPVLALLPANQAVQGAADAAALAAADTASGLQPGVPCDTAGRAAELNGARLGACTVDGLIATVTVSRTAGLLTIQSSARAGPAP